MLASSGKFVYIRCVKQSRNEFMHIKEFCDYLKYERNYSALTVDSYARDLAKFETYARGQMNLDPGTDLDETRIDERCLRRWLASMLESGNSAASVNRRLSSMRSYFKFLVVTGRYDSDPTQRILGPKKEKALPYFVKEKEIDMLLDDIPVAPTFEGQRNHFIIEMFYDTGIRLSELTSLNTDDVDFGAKQIKVTGKRNKQRIIPVVPRLLETARDFIGKYGGKNGTALFADEKGRRLSNAAVREIVNRELSLVTTMKKRSPHVLRHSFATAMLNHGADIEAVKRLLGHESLATTEIYTHTSLEELKKNYQLAHPRA